MTALRRRVLRPVPIEPVTDPRQVARTQRQRLKLAKCRAALRRWLTRLKRAANTVSALHQQIARLETRLSAG